MSEMYTEGTEKGMLIPIIDQKKRGNPNFFHSK